MPDPIPESAVCLSCGYALRGLSETRCPECGRAFDPRNHRSYGPRPTWVDRTAACPSKRDCRFAVIVLILALNEFSVPGMSWFSGLLLMWCVVILLSILLSFVVVVRFLIGVVAMAVRLRSGRATLESVRANRWRWMVIPICAAVFASMTVYNWPLQVRFYLSRSALERAVVRYQAGKLDGESWHWIGCYWIERIYEPLTANVPGGVLFETGVYVIDPVGFHNGPVATAPGKTAHTFGPNWRVGIDD